MQREIYDLSNRQRVNNAIPSTYERRQNGGKTFNIRMTKTPEEETKHVILIGNFFKPTPNPESTEETGHVPFQKLLINEPTGPKIINISGGRD